MRQDYIFLLKGHIFLIEWLFTKEKLNKRGLYIFVEWSRASLMYDRILNVTLSEELFTTGITQRNLELPLPPNSLDSHQTPKH